MTKRSDITGVEVLGVVRNLNAPASLQDITRACGLPTSGTRYANDNECHVRGILSDAVRVGVVRVGAVVNGLNIYTIGREIG